jgi:ADP-ribosyl-[dinitrogen reductase] hydrolase
MVGGGKFRLAPGEWTDDTSMALCLADSLLACNGFDPADQMARYWRWGEEGYRSVRPHPIGMGKNVVQAMRRWGAVSHIQNRFQNSPARPAPTWRILNLVAG